MYICAIANQKGGVGKTTTTHNLGVQLARNAKKRVLLLDLDAQGNLSDACGLEPQTLERTVFDVLAGSAPIAKAKSTLEEGLDILPANIRLAEAELAFAGRMGRENLLKKALTSVAGEYDYVLIDCPPSLGLLTVNALNAANGLLVPVQVEYYALAGLALIRQTADEKKMWLTWPGNYFNDEMSADAAGIVVTLYALNDFAEQISPAFGEKHRQLYDYIESHPEAQAIYAAID